MSSCSKCEAELPEGAHFCNKCGSPQIAAAAPAKEETPKITPGGMPIVNTTRSIQPGAKRTPQRRAAIENASSYTPATPPKNIPGADDKKLPLAPSQPDLSGSLTQSDAPSSLTPPDKQGRPGIIVITPTQVAQEPSGRKAAPGLIRPIRTASAPKFPTNPVKPIPRRPGQPTQPPATPTPQAGQPQSFTKPAQTFSQSEIADQVAWQEPAQGRLIENLPTGRLPKGIVQATPGMAYEPAMAGWSQENLDATSRAAEHWRDSWRDRQRAEAGPIVDVSRGDASVPMPLMAMQNSLVRLRAIVTTNKQKQQERGINLSFWVTILLMVCLIGGLGIYVISTYLPNSLFGVAHIAASQDKFQPTLTIQGSQVATFKPGQTLQLHGEHFGANDSIAFLLDYNTPITNAQGKPLTEQASSQGIFDVSLPVGKDWLAGAHLISAQDTRTAQNAYLNIEVSPLGTPVTTSNNLALSTSKLMFKAVIGQGNPAQQRVKLTNTSGAVLQWSATASADSNLSWLVIDDNHTSGSLDISGTDTIGISVLVTGLNSSPTPYKGQIVFTIDGKEQLTLPVELQVVDAQAEIIFSPNPLTGIVNPGNGTCQSGTTLTLINLGSAVITWTIKSDSLSQSHISFLFSNGKPAIQGLLQPSGTPGDTQVLTLQCKNVRAGDSYQSVLYANNLQWIVLALIRTSS